MNNLEKGQLAILLKRKEMLIDNMVGAVEDINQQIKEVKSGTWLKEVQGKAVSTDDKFIGLLEAHGGDI